MAGCRVSGASKEGIDLLQQYLHATGDVQSVALLCIRAFPDTLHHEATVKVGSLIVSFNLNLNELRNSLKHG